MHGSTHIDELVESERRERLRTTRKWYDTTLEASNAKLADALNTNRSLRREIEEKNSAAQWREKEHLVEISNLKEELYRQREENRRLVLSKATYCYNEQALCALSRSYESELERLRVRIEMLKNNYIDNGISDKWLRNEVCVIDQSVPSHSAESQGPSHTTRVECMDINPVPSLPLAHTRTSLERVPFTSHSILPIDTSYVIKSSERVIRQDYVFLRVTRHWSRFYCILSDSRVLVFFNTADDVSKSRHVLRLKFASSIMPVTYPSQPFAIMIECGMDDNKYTVEMAFPGKNERSIWMIPLINFLHSNSNDVVS